MLGQDQMLTRDQHSIIGAVGEVDRAQLLACQRTRENKSLNS